MSRPTDAREDAAVAALISEWNLHEPDARRMVRIVLRSADAHTFPEKLTTSPERVQIPAESEHVAPCEWFCEQHPWEAMGHDGCDGAGILDCARWPMAQHIIRMRDQEIREIHHQYGFLAKRALSETGGAGALDSLPVETPPIVSTNAVASRAKVACPIPTCRAELLPGQTCGGVSCGLRRKDATE